MGEYGTTIVAIPSNVEVSDHVDGGAHITLAYFGDTPLSEEMVVELTGMVRAIAQSYCADTGSRHYPKGNDQTLEEFRNA